MPCPGAAGPAPAGRQGGKGAATAQCTRQGSACRRVQRGCAHTASHAPRVSAAPAHRGRVHSPHLCSRAWRSDAEEAGTTMSQPAVQPTVRPRRPMGGDLFFTSANSSCSSASASAAEGRGRRRDGGTAVSPVQPGAAKALRHDADRAAKPGQGCTGSGLKARCEARPLPGAPEAGTSSQEAWAARSRASSSRMYRSNSWWWKPCV